MRPPHFWRGGLDPKSREAAPLTRLMLSPLAAVYGWAGARRIRKTTPEKVPIPVICVGNLTLGGSGKTPIVSALRDQINGQGLRAASLSRGYKGRLKGPLRVDPSKHTAADTGDEPLMLAAHGESWIGADRPAAARAMAEAGVDIIIMDDGHQTPTLHKDLSLVVIDAGDPYGNGHVFPKGPLREPVPQGLSRADGIIVAGHGPGLKGAPPCPLLTAEIVPLSPPPAEPLVAFAGIGRPEKFFDSLTVAGATLTETVPYPDHHPYTDTDAAWLATLARERGARLITTEKDAVRLSPDFAQSVTAWPVRAVISPQAVLDDLLARALQQASHGR